MVTIPRTIKWTFLIILITYLFTDETNINHESSTSKIVDSKNDTTTDIIGTNQTFYLTTDNKNISLPLAKSLLNKPPPYEEYDIFRLAPNLTKSPNTIVSAYFRVAGKHSSGQYDDWMQIFLSLQDHMVIFTQPDMLPQIQEFRKHALDRTVIILMDIDDIPIGNLFPSEFWEDQLQRDPERERHKSYQLFWIWLTKIWCTTEAIRLNFFESDLFMYSDIGCFRNGPGEARYGGTTLILHRDKVPPHEMLYMAHQSPNPPKEALFDDKLGKPMNFYHSGTQFVAYKDTWTLFSSYFLDTIDRFLEKNMLIVDDQVVLQSTCLIHPEICAYVLGTEVKDKPYRGIRYVLHHGGEYHLWRYDKSIQT